MLIDTEYRYSRLRPATGWSVGNQHFGRCIHPECGGLTVQGVCVSCGAGRICSYCKNTILRDGRRGVAIPENADESISTHGICIECRYEILFPGGKPVAVAV
jgi:hypothetical protein